MHKYANPLKILSLVVAATGYFIAQELQRRETKELVEEVIAEREAEQNANLAELPS